MSRKNEFFQNKPEEERKTANCPNKPGELYKTEFLTNNPDEGEKTAFIPNKPVKPDFPAYSLEKDALTGLSCEFEVQYNFGRFRMY